MHEVNAVLDGQVIRLTCARCNASTTVPAQAMAWVEGFNDFIQKHRHAQ